ncbi:MAG: hypothetical protein KKB59_20040 [Spirochaetes bacterium]|nr:hypothetical protein [Spirochaetota bacterium]
MLKDAIALAAGYADMKQSAFAVYHNLLLDEGVVRARTADCGIEVSCPEVLVRAAVPASDLKRMVPALGGECALTVKRGHLYITSGLGEHKLKTAKDDQIPEYPTPPDDGWRPVSANEVRVLSVVATMADRTDSAAGMTSAVRLTPSWVAACVPTTLAFGWVAGMVSKPVCVPVAFLQGLEGEVEVAAEGRTIWVREVGGPSVRWSHQIEGSWPDGLCESTIMSARSHPKRVSYSAELSSLRALVGAASAAEKGMPGKGHKLTFSDGRVSMEAEGHGQRFQGSIAAPVECPEPRVIGVSPSRLAAVLKALDAAHDGESDLFVSIGDTVDPFLCWGGTPSIEIAMMPMTLI